MQYYSNQFPNTMILGMAMIFGPLNDGDGTDKAWDVTGVDFDESSSVWTVGGVGTSIALTKASD